ncbi:hypothetical protein D6C84_10078 [Aureobasidium pullulans]|uniref:Acyltransferase 3 domain-containing protein n=1 Tax=Aureobasidium pullulans TaxID=5580 RepID=A0A4S9X0N2_AURPU|nr:hypothetical protein D6C84_10078 [Aureobasidium pullulans]
MHSPHSSMSDDSPEDSHLLASYEKEAEQHVYERKPSIFGIGLPRLPSMSNPALLRPSNYSHHCRKTAFFMLPSFVQNRIRPSTKPQKALHPTGFLDGMRGVAAFLVIVFHLVVCCYDAKHGFASGDHGEHREFFKLPFIRIIYAGVTMVSIFFVVSGYALSYKPVKLMRTKNWQSLSQSLASSIFRRAIRLFLPCIVSTFFISLMIWSGLYDWASDFAKARGHYNPKHAIDIPTFDTFSGQMSFWLRETSSKLINPWTFTAKGTEVTIDGHLWTIPVEFRSSLILYLTQTGLSHLQTKFRMAILVFLIVWVHQMGRWEMILFYGGFLCAELDFHRSASAALALPTTTAATKPRNSKLKTVFYFLVFLLGIYLGCQPMKSASKTPGWTTLVSMIPDHIGNSKRYWPGWGAIMLVWSTSCSKLLQRCFDNRVAQYLGYISFSLYIVHGAVTHVIGYPLMNILDGLLGRDSAGVVAFSFGVGSFATLLLTVWFADIFTRAVDEPSVKFARWVEMKCNASLQ